MNTVIIFQRFLLIQSAIQFMKSITNWLNEWSSRWLNREKKSFGWDLIKIKLLLTFSLISFSFSSFFMKREEMRWVKRKMRFNWAVHSLIHSFPFISFNKIKFISWNSAKEFIHQRDFRLFSIFSHCFIFQQCSNILIVSNYCYNTSFFFQSFNLN